MTLRTFIRTVCMPSGGAAGRFLTLAPMGIGEVDIVIGPHPDPTLTFAEAAAVYATYPKVAKAKYVSVDGWVHVYGRFYRWRPGVPWFRKNRLGDLSPDWRRLNGKLTMVAIVVIRR